MTSFLKKRLLSFKYAFQGLLVLFRKTPNARIHLVMGTMAVALGFILHISSAEWVAVCIVIGMVFAMEAVNTAIECLSDFVTQKQIHPDIKKVKDLAAAGVLIAAIASAIVGIIIFLPKIF